jgi:acylphosphatase
VTEPRRVHVLVRGHVQAVGFRACAYERARALGVAGWVRNTADGAVEAELEGDPDRVQALVDWFGRGPRGARVDGVAVEARSVTGERGFSVR